MITDILSEMYNAISDNDIVIVCLSNEYAQSNNCMFELKLAKASEKEIIPIVFKDAFPFDSDELENLIGTSNLRFDIKSDNCIDKVVSNILEFYNTHSSPINIPNKINRSKSLSTTFSTSSTANEFFDSLSPPGGRQHSMSMPPQSNNTIITPRIVNETYITEMKKYIEKENLTELDLKCIKNILSKNPKALHSILPEKISIKGRIAFLQLLYT